MLWLIEAADDEAAADDMDIELAIELDILAIELDIELDMLAAELEAL